MSIPTFGNSTFIGYFEDDSAANLFITNNTKYIDDNGVPYPGLNYYNTTYNTTRILRSEDGENIWSSLDGNIEIVEVNTLASRTLLQSESGKTITNESASGTTTLYLPEDPIPGINFTFVCAEDTKEIGVRRSGSSNTVRKGTLTPGVGVLNL